MSVIALAPRAGRHTTPHAGLAHRASSASAGTATALAADPSQSPAGGTAPGLAAGTAPAINVTLSIPLGGDPYNPQTSRLLAVVRELVELGSGTVSVSSEHRPVASLVRSSAAVLATGLTGATQPSRLTVLAASRTVLRGGEALSLTRLEFDLLRHLAEHPRRVFSRVQLLSAVWGHEHAGVRTVDVHIRRLRAKVGVDLPLIATVYGVGYRLDDEADVLLDPDD